MSKGYNRMHTTANNRSFPIRSMDNNHIENFINLNIEKMKSIKSQALYEVGETGNMFEMELNGIQKMDKATAIKMISNIMYNLEPYLAELVIRGNNAYIMNISPSFESILGRKNVNDVGKSLLALPSQEEPASQEEPTKNKIYIFDDEDEYHDSGNHFGI